MEPNGQNSTTRFGVFELDTLSGELRKAGTRIHLQDQPLKVLMALLEQPGVVVTRGELKRLIWPDESFGDFDHAVNIAVAKLRAALADSADTPRFVETLQDIDSSSRSPPQRYCRRHGGKRSQALRIKPRCS
jgi:DNA-binding winged helix-turn-helix (wHTH) protein